MKKLIIFIVSGILLLTLGVKAEIIYMNCKFNEGWHNKNGKVEDVKRMPDLTISMNKEKRIIKTSDRNYEPYNSFKDSLHWSHKWTGWYDKYVFNTINGNLTLTGYNKEEKWEINFYYICDKTLKKF